MRINSFALLADRRVLIGGSFETVNGVSRRLLARLNADGSVDNSFQPQITSAAFAVQSTGRLIISGDRQFYRLNADGSLDPTFTSTPIETQNGFALSPRIQRDDKIIFTAFLGGIDVRRISRLNADGSADSSFQPYEGYLVGRCFPSE